MASEPSVRSADPPRLTGSFRVRIDVTTPKPELLALRARFFSQGRYVSPAENFWLSFFYGGFEDDDRIRAFIDEREQLLRDRFPKALRDILLSELSKSSKPLFAFRVSQIEYGSLDFTVDVTGVQQLVDLFDKNFDLFVALTAGYVHTAFGNATIVRPELYEVTLVNCSDIAWAFRSTTATAPAPGDPDATRLAHLKYVWNVVQGTLLLPVLLALAVCLVGMNAWYHERDLQRGEREELAKERGALLDLAKSQISSLTLQNTELAKAIAQSAASEVLALTQENVGLIKGIATASCCCNTCCDKTDESPSKLKADPKPNAKHPALCKKSR